MPPSQIYKKCVACQHTPDDQTLQLQAGAAEDDFIHLPSGPGRVACERQEEEEEDSKDLNQGLPALETDALPLRPNSS